jgi:hypothetical protein
MRQLSIYFLLLFGFLLHCGNKSFGQEKINISAGFDLPEGLNLGLHFQLKQAQIRIGVGTIPIKDESFISVSSDVYYHFAGLSELSNRRPWYGRIGLNYLRDESKKVFDKDLYLNLRVGRDFNISRKFGIEFDAGAGFLLFHERIRKESSSGWNLDFSFPVLPSFGICLFYRI